MDKKLRILVISTVFIVLILLAFLINNNFTGKSVSDFYTYTKAICDEKVCQDYYIICNGNNLVEKSPLTGSSIKNTRNITSQNLTENFCKN